MARRRSRNREDLQNSDVDRGHEPAAISVTRLRGRSRSGAAKARPSGTLSPTGGEGGGEGVRFMERLQEAQAPRQKKCNQALCILTSVNWRLKTSSLFSGREHHPGGVTVISGF